MRSYSAVEREQENKKKVAEMKGLKSRSLKQGQHSRQVYSGRYGCFSNIDFSLS